MEANPLQSVTTCFQKFVQYESVFAMQKDWDIIAVFYTSAAFL